MARDHQCDFCYNRPEFLIVFDYGRERSVCSAPVCFVRCMMETPKEDGKHLDQVNIHSIDVYEV
jgi:hypothetical protein